MSTFCVYVFFFFFKQKTAYEMRISDWSSDVCSSDLLSADQRRDAAGGVSAGFHFRSVGVPDAHAHIGDRGRLDDDQLVAADAGMAVGKRGGERGRHRQRRLARIAYGQVLAEPAHLVE